METHPDKSCITLVLVDDSLGFQTALTNHLRAQAHLALVQVASSGREALALPPDPAPDIVLLDIHLPDQLGLHLIKPLLAKWPHSKVIILTFDDYPRMRQAALKAGATDFVSKLNAAEQLVAAIHHAMYNSHGGPPDDSTGPAGRPPDDRQ